MKLNEAKRILKNASYLVENEKRTNEIANILSDDFGLEEIVSASNKGRVYYITLGDGQHDVYVIATYNKETRPGQAGYSFSFYGVPRVLCFVSP